MPKQASIKFEVDRITPVGMRAIKPFFTVKEGKVFLDDWHELASSPDDLEDICKSCFTGDFSTVNWDEIDVREVKAGLMDFLQKAFGDFN